MLKRFGAKRQEGGDAGGRNKRKRKKGEEEEKHLTEYRNPQSEPGTDKRMLLALFVVFIVIGVMQYFMPKPAQPPQQDKGKQQQQQPNARSCGCSRGNVHTCSAPHSGRSRQSAGESWRR